MRGLIGKFINKNDINAYIDKDGNINADGIQRVKRALFQAAYGDDELISKMAESTDDNVRNMTVALTNSAPIVARLNAKMDKDLAHKYDLSKTIAEAVKRLDSLRKQGKKVSDYLNEQSMFSEYEDTPEVKTLLKTLAENKRSAKKISSFINRMVEIAEAQGNPNEESLFGDVKPYKLQDIINIAKGEITNGREADLFQDTETSKGAERTGTESNETVAEGNGGEVSSEHTQGAETVQSEPVVKSMLESADGKVDESQMIPAFNYVGSVMEKNPKASFEDIRNEFAKKYGEDNAKDFKPLLKLGFIGAVFSRKLEVKPDYERGYILVDGGIGKQIDRGLDILHGNDEKGDREKYNLIAKI